MQLRVARLCLDCEELHVEDSCPVCASERYAFLSRWLPSEERRRWRRPAPAALASATTVGGALARLVAHLLGRPEPAKVQAGPRTRASDVVPKLDFDPPAKVPGTGSPTLDPRPVTRDSGR
jgi:hypothetical protein